MRKYELIYVLKTATDDEQKALIADKLKGIIEEAGSIEKIDVWGNRKLAYEINKLNEGYYVLVRFTSSAQVPKELDRNLKIYDSVIRHMIVKLDEV